MRHSTKTDTEQQEETIYDQIWEQMMDDPECAYSINQFCEVLVDEIKLLDNKDDAVQTDFTKPT